MPSHDLDEKPVQEAPPYLFPEDLLIRTLPFDRTGLVGSTVAGNQLPESNDSSDDLQNGVDEVVMNGVLGDGSERKEEEGVFVTSDQVCSVSESPVMPVAGEYTSEGLVSSDDDVEVNNEKEDCEFHKLVPFDFNVSSAEDAPEANGYSGEGEIMNGLSRDLNFSNLWSNQGSVSYDPLGNHPLHTANVKVDGFPMGQIDDMMSGLSVRDLIISSNALALSASLDPSFGPAGGHHYMDNIHLNSHMGHYAPPPMMPGLRYGSSSSPNSVLDPLKLVNSYKGLVPRQVVPDQYARHIHLNGQVSPYAPPVCPMMTDLSLGASSSFSNGMSGVKNNPNALGFIGMKMNKHILEMSMSRAGSRCLLDLMSSGDPTEIDTILAAVASDIFTVMATNEHGFKVLSHLLKCCDQTQKEFLLDRIVSDWIGVILRAQTFYGNSKALIELVDHLKWSEQIHQVPSILAMEIKPMLFDRFASVVIQHCLDVLKPKQNERLTEAVIECACCLALDVRRCSVLYNLIDRLKGVHRTRLLNKLADNSVMLAFHATGNYVVKHILDLKDIHITRKVSYLLRGHYKSLAMDKHGSHVVETCLQSAGIHFVMEDFLKEPPEELEELACHQFANYVIKKAIEATAKCNLSYHEELVGALLPGLARIKESPHGKNVYQKLKDETRRRNGRARRYDAE